jgi:hypothetical protein
MTKRCSTLSVAVPNFLLFIIRKTYMIGFLKNKLIMSVMLSGV